MPIYIVDRRAYVGKVAGQLDGVTGAALGTHVRPPGRTGVISSQLGAVIGSVIGGVTGSANRTGTIVASLGGVGASVVGTFVPASGIINVANVSQLMAAVNTANSAGGGRIISLADGTYTIPDALFINSPNVTLRSASGIRENVIVQGDAMTASAAVPFNVRVAGSNFLAQNITFGGRCRYSVFQVVGELGLTNIRLTNCVLRDSFEHLFKSSTDGTLGTANGIIENCLFYFTAGLAPAQYNGGIDVHKGTGWIVRDNSFRDIASPTTTPCQDAVSFWNGGSTCVTERNKVIDCDKGINSGLVATTTVGPAQAQTGDIIRNNMISHAANGDPAADVQLHIENTVNCKVYNNTIFAAHSFPWAAEHRFTNPGSEFRNNYTNKAIQLRDGSTASVDASNKTTAIAAHFVNVATGDLHLASSVAGIVDSGTSISISDDYDKQSRPIGVAIDIGADEYSADPLDLPLIPANWPGLFSSVGSFSIPATIKQDAGVGSGGLALSADGNTMYVTSFFASIAKMSVPASGTGTSNLINGWVATPGSAGANQNKCSSLEYNGSLYVSKYSTYTDVAQSAWVMRGNTSLGGFTGLSSTSGQNTRLFAQAMIQLSPTWAAKLGKPCAAIGSRVSIISNAQCGYGFVLFDPVNVGGNVPVVPLLNYPYSNPVEPGDSSFPGWAGAPKNALGGTDLFSSTNAYVGTAFIVPGSRTLIFVTAHGYGLSNNGCRNGSSVHNDPNRMQIVAYDMRDLWRVFNGEIQAYAPRPYAWWEWSAGYGGVHWNNCVGGVPMEAGYACFDQAKNRMYMCTDMFGSNMFSYNVGTYSP